MSSKRLSLRFNLNNPGDLAAWEYLHRLDGDSINKEIISMINASKQNNDLRELLRQTITVAMQGMALQPVEKKAEISENGRRMAMKKSELRELYLMMFPEYPDIVNITQLQSMLGISRHLAYDLINDGYIRGLKIGNAFRIPKVNVIEYVMDQGKSAI